MNYPLASSTWDESEYQAIDRVIKSGNFTMGSEVFEFERRFADFVGSRFAVMVNSGSSANLAMIAALFFRAKGRLSRGDEVIVPAVSWSTTYAPLQQLGLKVKFIDIDRETLNLDIQKLRSAITDETRVIFAVNLLGNPNDFIKIKNIIGDRDIILLEDNCESLGAVFDGRQSGTFGLMGTFSLFFSHHISTMEGGVVISNDEELHHILLSIRAHGWTRNLPKHNLVSSTKSEDIFYESFRFVLPGFNLRPLELSGAIGIEQLKKLKEMIRVRRENAHYFIELFKELEWVQIQKETGESSWFGFSVILNEKSLIKRKDVLNKLAQRNIDVRPIVAGNFTRNEALRWFDYSVHSTLPNSDLVHDNGFFVGNHHFSIRSQIDYLYETLNEAIT